jgi:6-phosphogluconate dehydrogenase
VRGTAHIVEDWPEERSMQSIGMVGLGRMGGNMSRRIARGGLSVVAWDRSAGPREALAQERGVVTVDTLEALVAALPTPRAVWVMLPASRAASGVSTTATV